MGCAMLGIVVAIALVDGRRMLLRIADQKMPPLVDVTGRHLRFCHLCVRNIPNDRFIWHLWGHSSQEREQWPGGTAALVRAGNAAGDQSTLEELEV